MKQSYIHDCSVHQTGPGEVRFSEKFTLIRVRWTVISNGFPQRFPSSLKHSDLDALLMLRPNPPRAQIFEGGPP